MKAIKERAKEALNKYDHNIYYHYSELTEDSFVDGYIEGATEQQAIDEEFYTAEMLRVEREAKEQRLITIGKACEWLGYCLPEMEYITNASALRQNKKEFIESFRKAMTTKFDPLFEECLAMVDSEIRAEVRANMGKEV